MSQSIDALGLEPRTRNALQRNGVSTVAALRRLSDDDLLRFRGFGARCLRDVASALYFRDPVKLAAAANVFRAALQRREARQAAGAPE